MSMGVILGTSVLAFALAFISVRMEERQLGAKRLFFTLSFWFMALTVLIAQLSVEDAVLSDLLEGVFVVMVMICIVITFLMFVATLQDVIEYVRMPERERKRR